MATRKQLASLKLANAARKRKRMVRKVAKVVVPVLALGGAAYGYKVYQEKKA